MADKREQPRVAFGLLVESGLVPPGPMLTDAKRRWTARVRADGSIACDAHAGSIHKVGAALQGAPSCNGWTFWHVEQGGLAAAASTPCGNSISPRYSAALMRTLLRPTAFVDSPFGHDGKVARLAGGLNWFAAVELIQRRGQQARLDRAGAGRGDRDRFDDDMAAAMGAR